VLARYEADTLLIVLPGTERPDLPRVVERLRREVDEVASGVHWGAVAAAWDWTGGQDPLLDLAEHALLRARSTGRPVMAEAAPPRRRP
jgi:GGDEF domain-containing protein